MTGRTDIHIRANDRHTFCRSYVFLNVFSTVVFAEMFSHIEANRTQTPDQSCVQPYGV